MTQGDRELIERFKGWSNQSVIAECRGQARGCLDPEYSAFMNETADRLQALSAEVEMYRGALATCDDAIREYFRYFHGGEMRGSYDGKPERAQLQKAGHAASQALKGASNG